MNLARLERYARFDAARPFTGRICAVTYGRHVVRTVTGTVVGPSRHFSNGNSTGDLIIRENTRERGLVSVALAQITNVEVIE